MKPMILDCEGLTWLHYHHSSDCWREATPEDGNLEAAARAATVNNPPFEEDLLYVKPIIAAWLGVNDE